MSKKTPRLKKSFVNIKDMKKEERNGLCKEILSLLMRAMSPNSISHHFKSSRNIRIKPSYIKSLLLSYANRIKNLNEKFDKIAARMITILEMDETFKGMKKKILVVIDSITGYVYLVKQIAYKSEKCITNTLKHLVFNTNNVDLVLTDGANYFPKVIKQVFPNAKHQLCLIHIMRNLRPHLIELAERYNMVKEKRKEHSKKKRNMENTKKEKGYNLKKLKQQHKTNLEKRENEHIRLGVKKNQKGILKLYPDLKELNLKINTLNSRVKSLENTLINLKAKIIVLKPIIKSELKEEHKEWNIYMKDCRIYRTFYSLFFYSDKEYMRRKSAFLIKLDKEKKNKLRNYIIKLLKKVPGVDAVNRESAQFPLKRNFQNTNGIESFNSRFRPLLEILRVIKMSAYSDTLFQLFKLYVNTTTPTKSSRGNCSPIESCGYNLRGLSTVEIIVDGLPSGPQYDIFLPNLNPTLTARKMKKKKVFS